jgi:hypothetical protein
MTRAEFEALPQAQREALIRLHARSGIPWEVHSHLREAPCSP